MKEAKGIVKNCHILDADEINVMERSMKAIMIRLCEWPELQW